MTVPPDPVFTLGAHIARHILQAIALIGIATLTYLWLAEVAEIARWFRRKEDGK